MYHQILSGYRKPREDVMPAMVYFPTYKVLPCSAMRNANHSTEAKHINWDRAVIANVLLVDTVG